VVDSVKEQQRWSYSLFSSGGRNRPWEQFNSLEAMTLLYIQTSFIFFFSRKEAEVLKMIQKFVCHLNFVWGFRTSRSFSTLSQYSSKHFVDFSYCCSCFFL